jgi:MYXO-CTERM domain-containing protein
LGVTFESDTHILYTWGPNGAVGNWLITGNPDLPSHQAWYDDETIALTVLRDDGEGGYFHIMYLVPDMHDVPEEEATLIMTCEATPDEQRILPTGQFAFRGSELFVESNFGIYLMQSDAGIYDCSTESAQNLLLTGEQSASNFDVSDDGGRLVFQNEEATAIYTVVTDGESTPTLISPEDAAEQRFPQFALGGLQVVWTSSYLFDAEAEVPMAEGTFTRIYRANFDGSNPFLIYSSEVSIGQTIEATTGDQRGNTCSFGLPFGGGSGGLVALGLGLVVALRRRRPSAPR